MAEGVDEEKETTTVDVVGRRKGKMLRDERGGGSEKN